MSQRDRALQAIREVILSGRIRAGERTSERRLTEGFLAGTDLGRTPVREALAVLTEQGIVEQYPQVGFSVRRVEATEARRVLALQRITERVVAAEGARRHIDVQPLRRIAADLAEAAERGQASRAMNLARTLHVTLAEAAGYGSAVEPLGGFRDRFALFFAATQPLAGRELTEVAVQSDRLVEAVAADASGEEALERLDELIETEAALVATREAARQAELLEAQRLVIERKPEDLASVVESAVGQARAITDRHPLRLIAHRDLIAFVDAARIEECVGHLLANAIKFSPPGRPIEVELSAPQEGRAQLAVRDHGMGIPQSDQARVFDRAFQSRGSLGSELGLYVCRGIVELHGGSIEVRTPEDGGARFEITLPTQVAAAHERAQHVVA